MYKNIESNLAYRAFTGGPMICIFTKSKAGTPNGMSAAWNCPFDTDELILVLDKEHTTSENIRNGSKIVVAVPSSNQISEILKLGSIHGRDCSVNKFVEQNVDTEESELFKFPVIKGALAYFECELNDKALFEDKGICLVKVKNCYVQENMWDEASKSFKKGCLNSLHHVSEAVFCTGGELVSND